MEEMVLVELVCDRTEKNDCRGGTATLWHGQGDVQAYPKRLWPKLQPHPDVWKLVGQVGTEQHDTSVISTLVPSGNAQLSTEGGGAPEGTQTNFGTGDTLAAQQAAIDKAAADAKAEADAQYALERAEFLAEGGYILMVDGKELPITDIKPDELTEHPDDDIRAEAVRRGYDLHPRLNRANLMTKFLEAQDVQLEEPRRLRAEEKAKTPPEGGAPEGDVPTGAVSETPPGA